jgi:hypothetical protein
MTEERLNTLVTSVTAVLLALIGIAQIKQARRTKEIGTQVVNDHKNKPNLRDDIDTIKSGLKMLSMDVGGLREEQRQVRREIYDQGVYGRDNRHLIHELEKTLKDMKR